LKNEISLLKEKFPKSKITVFSWNPNLIENQFWVYAEYLPPIAWYRFYKFLNIFYLFNFLKIIKSTDLLVLWWWWFFSDRQFLLFDDGLDIANYLDIFEQKLFDFECEQGHFFMM